MNAPRLKYGGPIYGGPIIDTPDPSLEINYGPFAAEIKILRLDAVALGIEKEDQ